MSISNLALRSARRRGDALVCCKAAPGTSTAKFTELRPVTPLSPHSQPARKPDELSTTALSTRDAAQENLRAMMHDKHEMTRTAHWTSGIAHAYLRTIIDITVQIK